MARIKVVTDSAADLPGEILRELDITVVPLVVTFGDRTYQDTELSREEFWRLAKGPVAPGTSQPSVGAFREAFRHLVEQGHQVLCVTLTGRHSGTFNSAWSAAQPFGDDVTVVDSLSLSWGQGWQVITAARMGMQNAPRDAILARLHSLRERTNLFILLDTVESLRRGGRAAKLMPIIDRLARALRLKPIINMVDGELKLLGVARTYQKGTKRVAAEIVRLGSLEQLAVMHTRRPDAAQKLADDLAALANVTRRDIVVMETGAVLASHAGEGVIAAAGVAAE